MGCQIKKDKMTNIVCVLDRSGSMANIVSDVIGGYNAFIEEQSKVEGEATVTTYLFDDIVDKIYDKVDVKSAPVLTTANYSARGSTALYDALGKAILDFITEDKVFVFVHTDGYENSSKEWKANTLQTLIKEKEADGWKFLFVGSGIDADKASAGLGIANTMSGTRACSDTTALYGNISGQSTLYRIS